MMGWMAPLRHLGAKVLVGFLLIHAGEFVARLAHYMQHLDSDHIRKYAAELCRMARLRYAESTNSSSPAGLE